VKKLFENWRKYLDEHGNISVSADAAEKEKGDWLKDVPAGMQAMRKNILQKRKLERRNLRKIINTIRKRFAVSFTSGDRPKKLINYIHKVGSEKDYKKVERHYKNVIAPKLTIAVMKIIIAPGGECWASLTVPRERPGKQISDVIGGDHLIRYCKHYLDTDYNNSQHFSNSQEKYESLENSLIHELNHYVDYLWAGPVIDFPGKPSESEEFSISNIEFAKSVGSDEDDTWIWSAGAPGLGADQKDIMQKAYSLVLNTTGLDQQGVVRRGDMRGAYNQRAIEVYANLQSILWKVKKLDMPDIKLICELKGLVRDQALPRELQRFNRILATLRKKGWDSSLVHSYERYEKTGVFISNMFLQNLLCDDLTEDDVKQLNQIASVLPTKEFEKFIIGSKKERGYA
jgi:hypothetical protein